MMGIIREAEREPVDAAGLRLSLARIAMHGSLNTRGLMFDIVRAALRMGQLGTR